MRAHAGRLGRGRARRLSAGAPGDGGASVPTAPIGSPRLRLEPLAVEDAPEMAVALADPSLYAFTGGEPPTEDDLRARYARQVEGGPADGSERWHNWVVRRRDDGTAIGFVQATVTGGGRSADLAWVVGVPWQGRGYAGEAAAAMAGWLAGCGVATLTAHIRPDHAASAAVARRLGLVATDVIEDGEAVWRSAPRSAGGAA